MRAKQKEINSTKNYIRHKNSAEFSAGITPVNKRLKKVEFVPMLNYLPP
jgi:hypothetical protein